MMGKKSAEAANIAGQDGDGVPDNQISENDLIDQMAGILGGLEEPELPSEAEDEDTAPEGNEENESDEDQDAEKEESEDEDAEELQYSIRIDGKKVDIGEFLEQTTHIAVVGGEEIEVPYTELIKGYQRGRDYADKTTELKAQREELRPFAQLVAYAKNDQQFQEYVKSYFENGPFPEAANNPDLRVPDEELADIMDEESQNYDPHRASQILKARKEWITKMSSRKEVDKKAQDERDAMLQEWAESELSKAKDLIAQEGGDLEKDARNMAGTMLDIGFTKEQILNMLDSKLQLLAWMAAQYKEMKNSATTPGIRLGAKRKKIAAPRIAGVGTGKRESTQIRQTRDTFRKAVKTQKEDDWVNAIAAQLKL